MSAAEQGRRPHTFVEGGINDRMGSLGYALIYDGKAKSW